MLALGTGKALDKKQHVWFRSGWDGRAQQPSVGTRAMLSGVGRVGKHCCALRITIPSFLPLRGILTFVLPVLGPSPQPGPFPAPGMNPYWSASHEVLILLAKYSGYENIPLRSPTVGSVIRYQPICSARKSIPALAMAHISLGLLPANDRVRQG